MKARERLTQEDLAARLTVLGLPMDRSTVSRIENQSRSLNDIEAWYFAKALRVSFRELLDRHLRARSPSAGYPENEFTGESEAVADPEAE